ncbi:MAG TPA: GatB/YqeY domain-containing protein [Firmicutes bacterium]|nr:GatB/YqeY domain-containing protein [Bacillota bacterium]
MDPLQRLLDDQKMAMKAGDKLRLGVIRFLRSELKNAEIAKKGPLNEGEAVAIVQRELKRRKEAMLDYEKADRPALVKELKEEIEILSDYLPPQLSEDEIKEMVQSAITELGVFSKKEMGKLMGYLMPKVKGKADGSLVKKIVEELLELNLG